MKFLFDLFPVILFFVAFKLADIYVATAVAIGDHVRCRSAGCKLRGKRVDPMLWASLGIIAVFGGATLLLQDETFIKWKPTVLYWLFGAVLAGAALVFRRNLVRAMLSRAGAAARSGLERLNWSWVAFFAFMGALNLYVAYNYSTDNWVNFKLFGGMGLMLLFVVAQALFLARYVEDGRERSRERRRRDPRAPRRARAAGARTGRRERAARGHAGQRRAAARTGGSPSSRRASPGKSTVARHRMVYQALGELMQHPIHALAIMRGAGEPRRNERESDEALLDC